MSASNAMPAIPKEQFSTALYQRVKTYIRNKARSGEWKPGDRIPSENELVRIFGVSRMTINRALRELSDAGELVRRAGVGTFVAETRANSTLLMIARIGDEIRARGHHYRWHVILRAIERASAEIGAALALPVGATVFHLLCIHYENDVPLQLEDRYVNPVCVPQFLEERFDTQPPGEYLLAAVPADEIEHTVDAVLPGAETRFLKTEKNEPCLLLTRRTWAGNTPVTFAKLLYPASRYRLSCRFKPSNTQERG